MADQAPHSDEKKKRERGAVTVIESLREDILTLRLAPGSAIDEVALAGRFGLSRTPVREALFVLSGEGLVTFLENRTSIVTPHSMSNANDYLDTLSLLSRAVFRQAAERWREGDLAKLEGRLDRLKAAAQSGDVDLIEPCELDLRNEICGCTRNFFYQRYYPNCLDLGRRMLRLHYFPTVTADEISDRLSDYRLLIDALGRRDQEACDTLAQESIAKTVVVLQRSLVPSSAAQLPLGRGKAMHIKDLP